MAHTVAPFENILAGKNKVKVLITWHAAVEPAYRKLYAKLSLQGVELLAVTPSCWTEGCRLQRFREGAQDSGYEWMTLNIVFTDHIRAFFYPNVFSLARRVLAFKPDIFHIIEEPFSAAAAQFILLRDIFCPEAKIILHSFENLDIHQGFPFSYIRDFNLRRADTLVTTPKEGKKLWENGGFKGEIYTIPLGLDTDLFRPLEKTEDFSRPVSSYTPNRGNFNISYVGRLLEGKGIDDLIDATYLLKKMGRQVALFIVGSGNLRKKLEEKVSSLQLSQEVQFINNLKQSQLPLFFHHVDVLVLPSTTGTKWKEQFGRVLVEAMACKVPVVGSSSGEIPNVVGDAGLIFKEGNVKDLSGCLDLLIVNKEARERMALKGFKRVKEMYTWTTVAKKLAGIYEEVLKC